MPLNNLSFLGPHMARCAQPVTAKDFQDLLQLGARATYKLNESSGRDSFPRDEESRLLGPGTVVCEDPYPAVLVLAPPISRLRKSVEQAKSFVEHFTAEGKGVLVAHCRRGRERTGAFCGSWRIIIERWGIRPVLDEFRAHGAVGLVELADSRIEAALRQLALEEGTG